MFLIIGILIVGNEEGYFYLFFGKWDEVFRGDDVISVILKFLIIVYVGDSL